MCFIYNFTYDDDPEVPSTLLNDETYIINFTGPGTITVDGEIEDPIDELDGTYTQAELDAEFGAGRGGIRIAHQVAVGTPEPLPATTVMTAISSGPTRIFGMRASCRPRARVALTGHDFDDFFDVVNDPGENDYQLISLVVPGLSGDFNEDDKVDAADYVMWRKLVPTRCRTTTDSPPLLIATTCGGPTSADAGSRRRCRIGGAGTWYDAADAFRFGFTFGIPKASNLKLGKCRDRCLSRNLDSSPPVGLASIK